jgi:hypothetical protein
MGLAHCGDEGRALRKKLTPVRAVLASAVEE